MRGTPLRADAAVILCSPESARCDTNLRAGAHASPVARARPAAYIHPNPLPLWEFTMNRRHFLSTSAALAAANAYGALADDTKPLRVGLIGTGWYGKCDLFRLIQVA